jgi:hypothetical protein
VSAGAQECQAGGGDDHCRRHAQEEQKEVIGSVRPTAPIEECHVQILQWNIRHAHACLPFGGL